MRKRVLSFLLVLAMIVSVQTPAFAATDETQASPSMTTEEKEQIYQTYLRDEPLLDEFLASDTNIAYWLLSHQDKDPFWDMTVEMSSSLIGVKTDEKFYADIIIALITLRQGNLAEQIEKQSQFDHLKTGTDSASDVFNIIGETVGAERYQKKIEPILHAALTGVDTLIDTSDKAKYWQMAIQDYSDSELFLTAIKENTENRMLKRAATELLHACRLLFEQRLKYCAESAEELTAYTVQFTLTHFTGELLKTTRQYKSNSFVQWFADEGLSLVGAADSAFRQILLRGNLGLGTTNTFYRYQEIQALAAIADALTAAKNNISIPQDADPETVFEEIQEKCELYRCLIAAHARGEFLFYQIYAKDSGILSAFAEWKTSFQAPGEANEESHKQQVGVFTQYMDLIDALFRSQQQDDGLTAEQLQWLVQPTWDYQAVSPISGVPFSDIALNPNFANGFLPFFLEDDVFPFIEMSFPLYSNLPEYYRVTDAQGKNQIFYMPDRIDSSHLGLEFYWPYRMDASGIFSLIDYNANLSNDPVWHVLHGTIRGMMVGYLVWDRDSQQCCFFCSGEGAFAYKKGTLLNLHKPYPVIETSLGNLVQQLGDEAYTIFPDANSWPWEQICSQNSPFGYVAEDGTMLTDFIYQCADDFSDGLAACSKDGKTWGYIDSSGNPLTDFIYEPVWVTANPEDSTNGDGAQQAYPCTDDTMVVKKEGEYGLLYRDGTTLIAFGELEEIAPSWNNQLWAKQNGKWGLIDLADAKQQANLPSESGAAQSASQTPQETWEQFLQATGKTQIAYIPADYDGDGTQEAFGIVGQLDLPGENNYTDVSIYFIDSTGTLTLMCKEKKNGENLYGYLHEIPLLSVGSQQFLLWEVSAYGSGSVTLILGVQQGKAYAPLISQQYMDVSLTDTGEIIGFTSDFSNGFHEYIQHTFRFDEASGQFEEIPS